MDTKNKFDKIIPSVSGFTKIIAVQGIFDDLEGFRVIVKGNDNNDYTLKFDRHIIGYRHFDEGDRFNSKYEFSCDIKYWSLFKSYNSDFIDWLNTETFSPYDYGEVLHVILIAQNNIIDILAFDEPKIVALLNA